MLFEMSTNGKVPEMKIVVRNCMQDTRASDESKLMSNDLLTGRCEYLHVKMAFKSKCGLK